MSKARWVPWGRDGFQWALDAGHIWYVGGDWVGKKGIYAILFDLGLAVLSSPAFGSDGTVVGIERAKAWAEATPIPKRSSPRAKKRKTAWDRLMGKPVV